jgi:hypothetical protein
MADLADLAFDSEQNHLAQAFAAQRLRGALLQPTGSCHFCGNTDAGEGRLFCDTSCAADWEYEHALRRKLGLPRAQSARRGFGMSVAVQK